jgi:hypothetical protein
LGKKKEDDLVTIVIGVVVAVIVVAYAAYAFALVLISFGWLAVLGFLFQCGRALYDGKLNLQTVTKFGVSGVISGAFGIVAGQLSSNRRVFANFVCHARPNDRRDWLESSFLLYLLIALTDRTVVFSCVCVGLVVRDDDDADNED